MFNSWKLGRVAGIDLFVHPTFLLLLAAVFLFEGGLLAVAMIVAVFGCVLLHELGHALTARGYGIPTHSITLYPIGGVARLERLPRKPGAELLVTIAGPAVNVVIALTLGAVLTLGYTLHPGGDLTFAGEFLRTLMLINVALAVFNLLPAFPMDGGRIFRALLSPWLGRLRATEVAVSVARVLALGLPVVLMALGIFNPMHLLLAAFVFLASGAELRQIRAEETSTRPVPTPRLDGTGAGIWFAQPGYRWVRRGRDTWQLLPIVVTVAPHAAAWPPRPEQSPWRRP